MNKKNQGAESAMPENVKAQTKSSQKGSTTAKANARCKKCASKQQ